MPLVPLDSLPNDARAWVFAADPALDAARSAQLLATVDAYLPTWKAHGSPLTVGRSLTDGRFLTVAVDQHTAGASGCSIDGLFRVLQDAEEGIGTSMLGGGRIFFRGAGGLVISCTRQQFEAMAARGEVDAETVVFDTTVSTAADFRARFERRARESWHSQLFPASGGQARR